jgi:excisionase family DNA binding protein
MQEASGPCRGLSLLVPAELVEAIAASVADRLIAISATERDPTASLDLMTVREAAEYMRCSVQAIYDRISQGGLLPERDGRRVLLRRRTIDAYLRG